MFKNKLDFGSIINKYHKVFLAGILLLSFILNIAYVNWGLPGSWNPDEVIEKTINMVNHWTLNPHSFSYPHLHFYLLIFLILAPLLALEHISKFLNSLSPLSNWIPRFYLTKPANSVIAYHISQIFVLSRVLTAIMGVATVYIVYLIAQKIFNNKVGLISAAFLAITAGFVNLAHFSTTDIPLTFWCTLSFYLLLLALEKGMSSMYALAGFSIGLAASTKYPGVLMAIPLFMAYVIKTRERHGKKFCNYLLNKNLLIMVTTISAGFFIGTPLILIYFRDFLGNFIGGLFIQGSFAGIGQLGFIPHIYNIFDIYGVFGASISLLGFFYLLYLLFIHKYPKVLLLLTVIATIYLSMGRMMFYPDRYIMPLVPFLTICGGKLIYDLQESITLKSGKIAFIALFALGIAYTGTYTISGVLQMKNDDRNLALNWVLENVPETATVETTRYGINIPDEFSNFISLPTYHRKETFMRMESNDLYRKSMLALKLPVGDEENATSYIDPEPEEVSLEALLRRRPDYLILSERWYSRFFSEKANAEDYFPLQRHLYESLFDGQTPYKIVVDFRKEGNIFTPEWEFVNAGVTIFKYVDEE